MEDQAKRNDDKVRAGKDAAALAVPPEEPGVAPTGKEDARRERVIEAAWRILGDRGGPASLARFHRFSVAVWLFWLVPYVCGMLMGMPAAHATTGGALAVSAAVSVR